MNNRLKAIGPLLLLTILTAASVAGCSGAPAVTIDPTSTTIATTTTTTLSEAQIALESMTLRQKAAQVLLLSFSGTSLSEGTSALLEDGPPGGLLLLGTNVEGVEQLRSLTSALQVAAAATGAPVGLIIAVDQEGGVQRIKEGAPLIPTARDMAVTYTPADAARFAGDTATALLGMGVNMNLAPVADVVSDQDSFLYTRTYGGDPALVSTYVSTVVRSFNEQGLISVVKHFPGHGSATGDTHTEAAVSNASKATFESVHLPPFQAAIAAGAEGVMMSHIVAKTYDQYNAASASSAIARGLLRVQLGYDGLILTDDLRMSASTGVTSDHNGAGRARAQAGAAQAAVAALNAGCDLLIVIDNAGGKTVVLNAIVAAVEDGSLSQARLDDAVLRILELKFRHGIVAQAESGIPTATTTESL